MPSGRVHTVTNFAAIAAGSIILKNLTSIPSPLIATGAITAILGTLLLSPDNDTFSHPIKNWGLLRFFWLPYRKIFTHRGFSHSFPVGSITRIAYLFVTIAVTIGTFHLLQAYFAGAEPTQAATATKLNLSFLLTVAWRSVLSYEAYYLAGAIGLLVSDGLHVLLDWV